MRKFVRAAACAVVVLCMPVWGADAPKGPVASGTILKDESRIYIGPCLNPESRARKVAREGKTDIQGFIPPAVAVAAIDVLVDLAVGVVKAAAEDETMTVDSPFPVTRPFYRLGNDGTLSVNPFIECLQIVTGKFDGGAVASESVAAADKVDASDYKVIDASILEPRVFFEAEFVKVPGTDSAMALAPKVFFYGGPANKKFWEGGLVTRNVSINLTFQVVGSPPGTAIGNLSIPFRNVPAGLVVGPDYFAKVQLKPIQIPTLSAEDLKVIDAARAELTGIKKFMEPINVEVNPRIGTSYLSKLSTYCAAWQAYVNLKRKWHTDTKVAGDFVEPPNEDCPADVRQAQLVAGDQKAGLDRIAAVPGRTRDMQSAIASAKYVSCSTSACTLTSDVARDYVPLVVSAGLVELREASAFSKHLAAVADAMKPSVSAALKDLTPGAKEADVKSKQQAADAKAEEEKGYSESYYLAKANAEAQYQVWVAAAADQKDSIWPLVVEKRILANKAARKAKVDAPYKLD